MRRALFPSEVAASTPIGLSVSRFPAPHTLAAFSIRPRIHFGRLPRLNCHITGIFNRTITLWALRSLEPRSTYRAVFSGHCHSLWGETGTAHISRGRPGNWWNRPDSNWWPPDPKSGATNCATAPYWRQMEVSIPTAFTAHCFQDRLRGRSNSSAT